MGQEWYILHPTFALVISIFLIHLLFAPFHFFALHFSLESPTFMYRFIYF